MSLLVEIAEKAHVSVEGVVRVLTREPVSDAIKERVLLVLDDLDPEETRVLQRFALAALHDVLPRGQAGTAPADGDPVLVEAPLALPQAPDDPPAPVEAQLALSPAAEAPGEELAVSPSDPAPLVQLSSVLEELADAVRDLRRETDTERRERVDDLAVLIELISTGWQGLDRRLGRLERQLGRLETARQLPIPQQPARMQLPVPPVPAAAPPAPPAEPPVAPAEAVLPAAGAGLPQAEPPPPQAEAGARGKRDRLPLAAALALVGIVVGALAVLQLVSSDPDVASIVAARASSDGVGAQVEQPEPADVAATTSATTAPKPATPGSTPKRTTSAPATTADRTTPPTTSAVLGTQAAKPATGPKTAPAQTPPPARAPATTAGTTAAGTTAASTTASQPARFRPSRTWAWVPVDGADYYEVVFLRNGNYFYRTTTDASRLTLPNSVVFGPGTYRWLVRPGFGERADGDLREPVVDSSFTV
ncbi:MAG: hypothetical protein ACRDNB_00125 [Gaiellaceae bacterium]